MTSATINQHCQPFAYTCNSEAQPANVYHTQLRNLIDQVLVNVCASTGCVWSITALASQSPPLQVLFLPDAGAQQFCKEEIVWEDELGTETKQSVQLNFQIQVKKKRRNLCLWQMVFHWTTPARTRVKQFTLPWSTAIPATHTHPTQAYLCLPPPTNLSCN